MDGLLFDTETLFFEAMVAEGTEIGISVSRDFFLSLVGLNTESNHELMIAQFGADFSAAPFHDACQERFFNLLDSRLALKPGVLDLLDHIEQLGLPKAIATSSHRSNVDHHLGAFNLAHRFDLIVASGDYARGKPHPDPYLTAAKAFGLDPVDCLALEDSHNGVRSAAAAGMITVMVPDLLPANDEMRLLASFVANDLHEVARLLGAKPLQ